MLIVSLAGCGGKTIEIKTEEVPADYSGAVIVAQDEFNRVFSDFSNIIITETSTMARTDSTDRVIIQFSYTSDNGNGVYGFEMEKTATGSYDIIHQGEDVTMDNLVTESSQVTETETASAYLDVIINSLNEKRI